MLCVPKDIPFSCITFASHTLLSNVFFQQAFLAIMGPAIKEQMSLRSRGAAVELKAVRVVPTIIHSAAFGKLPVMLHSDSEVHDQLGTWYRRDAKRGGGYSTIVPPVRISHEEHKQKTTVSFFHAVFNFQGVCLYPHNYCE